ncbi:WD40-repeat-containing domain protein [Lipomyces oligophaga]|uniref:WD40-repeat-containing domain protein n=1 Tax=Lipomyces oligophaga TaxID=45792 RepID=UPI0034CFAFF2
MFKQNWTPNQTGSLNFASEYVYDIISTSIARSSNTQLAASLSDRTIRILEVSANLQARETSSISAAHEKKISKIALLEQSRSFASAGEDGVVKLWDLRSNECVQEMTTGTTPLLSMAYSSLTNTLATGTELDSQDAGLIVWDIRNSRVPARSYLDSHNDDVTAVAFHPSVRHCLLSGSTDGLITRYDSGISDEDDAVMQVINHGSSIHLAGFLDDHEDANAMYAASHMETVAFYKYTNKEEEDEDPDPSKVPMELGDVRQIWDCDYIIDISPNQGYVAVGSNSKLQFSLLQMNASSIDPYNRITFDKAHGEEIVRTIMVDKISGYIASGGEDGRVNLWAIDERALLPHDDSGWQVSSKKKTSQKQSSDFESIEYKGKHKHGNDKKHRFKPY